MIVGLRSLRTAAGRGAHGSRPLGHALLFAAVFLLGLCAVLLAPPGSAVAMWWPAAGVAAAAAAAVPRQPRWTVLSTVFLASAAANLAGGRPAAVACGFAVANTAEAAIVAWWLWRGSERRPRLTALLDLWRLLVAAVLGALAAGTVAALVVALQGGPAAAAGRSVLAAHLAAVLVIAPLFLATPEVRRGSVWETAGQWVAVLSTTVVVFGPGQQLPLAFLILPPLVWSALRAGVRRCAAQTLAAGVLVVLLTAQGHGPFFVAGQVAGASSAIVTGLLVQLLSAVTAVVALALAVAASAQREAIGRLTQSEAFLEALLDAADVGLIAVDADGGLTMVNQFTRRLSGVSDDEPVLDPGWVPAFTLLHPDGSTPLAEHEGPLARVLADGHLRDLAVVLRAPGQQPRHLRINGRALTSSDGEPAGAITVAHDVTALVQQQTQLQDALRELADSKQFVDAVLETVGAGVLACDASGRVVLRNRAQRRMTAVDDDETSIASEQVAGRITVRTPDGAELPAARSPLRLALAGQELTDWPVSITPSSGGTERHVIITARQIRGGDGGLLGAVAAFTDVTSERLIQAELRTEAAFHDAVLAATPDLVHVLDPRTNAEIWSSRDLHDLLGYSQETVDELGPEAVAALVHPDDGPKLLAVNLAAQSLADGGVMQARYRMRHSDGDYRWLSRRVTPFERDADGAVTRLLGVARDVTDTVTVEQRLAQAAMHDELTGLPNRRLLNDRLALALARTSRSGTPLTVLFCDLDGFKAVNDKGGHAAGDAVLLAASQRMAEALRPQDTVARVGGDEFVVLLEGVAAPARLPAEIPLQVGEPAASGARLSPEAAALVSRITEAIREPVVYDGQQYRVSVSIGITTGRAGQDPDEVLRGADAAMYRAKALGKDRHELHRPSTTAGH